MLVAVSIQPAPHFLEIAALDYSRRLQMWEKITTSHSVLEDNNLFRHAKLCGLGVHVLECRTQNYA